MGRINDKGGDIVSSGKTVALQVDSEGKVRYDAILKQGRRKDELVLYFALFCFYFSFLFYFLLCVFFCPFLFSQTIAIFRKVNQKKNTNTNTNAIHKYHPKVVVLQIEFFFC